MVYVALVAAAFTQARAGWADTLWLVSFLIFCYLSGVAIHADGIRRARALGFLIGSIALMAALVFGPIATPVGRTVHRISTLVSGTNGASGGGDIAKQVTANRVADNLATMFAGIVGSVLVAAAYRQCRSAPN
jgi:uncharacterized membrane protein YeaQ/YmgE (transglycosylase-associated protein family)